MKNKVCKIVITLRYCVLSKQSLNKLYLSSNILKINLYWKPVSGSLFLGTTVQVNYLTDRFKGVNWDNCLLCFKVRVLSIILPTRLDFLCASFKYQVHEMNIIYIKKRWKWKTHVENNWFRGNGCKIIFICFSTHILWTVISV